MMVLVTECHLFDDRNGRVARILTNAELVARGQHRIVIPTSYHNNYLAALNGVTYGNGVAPLTAALNWSVPSDTWTVSGQTPILQGSL